MLLTGLCILVLPAGLILTSAVVAVLALLGAPRSMIDRCYTGFARFCTFVARTETEARGVENIEPGRAYVVVANHESSWDPVVLLPALDKLSLRFVIKDAIMKIPVFGRALALSGNVRVVRSNTAGDIQRIRARMMERPVDVSMIFYAEGTRARDGSFRTFKRGAFATAIAYGLPILPVAVAGTYRIWKPEELWIRKGKVVILVGKPIPVDGLEYDDRSRLLEETHTVVGELRSAARRRLRNAGSDPGGKD
jgi:1-acyl-sn-glycerol-3-phosphate acyltransferase